VRSVLTAAAAALRPNGRLLLVTGRIDPVSTRKDTPPCDRGAAEALLTSDFRLLEHRQQGGLGSVGFIGFNRWLLQQVRRSPVLARIVEFTLPFIWVPILIAMNSIARAIGAVRDKLDRSNSSWMTSLSLAEKK
jgi:hypothetical protein